MPASLLIHTVNSCLVVLIQAVTGSYLYRQLPYLTAYKTHPNFSRANEKNNNKKQNIKRDKINIMNIINDHTFNLHNGLLNNDNKYTKVTLKFKLIGVAW